MFRRRPSRSLLRLLIIVLFPGYRRRSHDRRERRSLLGLVRLRLRLFRLFAGRWKFILTARLLAGHHRWSHDGRQGRLLLGLIWLRLFRMWLFSGRRKCGLIARLLARLRFRSLLIFIARLLTGLRFSWRLVYISW